MVAQGHSTREIAILTAKSQTTIRHWLRKHRLTTVYTQPITSVCKTCGERNPKKFHNKGNNRLSLSKCKSCHNKYSIERFRQYKLSAVAYKGGKCCYCGYSKCVASLHFHHRTPSEKDPNWTRMRTWKFDKIKKELDKCDLVCANCHGELHWDAQNTFGTSERKA